MQDNKIGFKVYYLSKLIKNNIENNHYHNEFTSMQGRVLHYLLGQDSECEIFQKDIEFEFKIKRSTASELLQTLEDKEYIKRIPTSYDGRLKRIYLLPKARLLAPKVARQIDEIEDVIIQNISNNDLKVFTNVLDMMIENMKKVD